MQNPLGSGGSNTEFDNISPATPIVATNTLLLIFALLFSKPGSSK